MKRIGRAAGQDHYTCFAQLGDDDSSGWLYDDVSAREAGSLEAAGMRSGKLYIATCGLTQHDGGASTHA